MDWDDIKAVARPLGITMVAFVISPLLGWFVVLLLGADIGYAAYKHYEGNE